MNALLGQLEYQREMRKLISDTNPTHAATLTLLPTFRTSAKAESVCEHFKRKLNKAVWGRDTYEKGRACLSYVACLQGNENDDLHIHMALGGFPGRFSEEQLASLFTNVARHTLGVWQQTDFAPIRGVKGEWVNYITRDLRLRNADTLLVQQIDMKAAPQAPTVSK